MIYKNVDCSHICNVYNWLEFRIQSIQRTTIDSNKKDSPIKKIKHK